MKRLIYATFTLLLLLMAATASAQQERQFSIVSFDPDPFDMTAKNEQYKKMDGSGSLYAIIKVTSATADDNLREYNFNFGNLNHIVVERSGELWVYVQRNAKHVTISRSGFATIRRYDLGTTIQEGLTYVMKLKAAPKQVFTQMVLFSVQPTDSRAAIMVKASGDNTVEDMLGIVDETGAAAKPLPYGTYTYRVMAEGFYPSTGQFTLNNMDVNQEEKVILRPKFALVTLRTTADADIYVNGQLKGRRTWRGRLDGGNYQVECRQQNHRPSTQTITVKENEPSTYDLTAPTPITGILSVTSQPLGATITIDNQPQSTTPRQFSKMVIGRHTITVSKAGYENATQTFDVTEGQTTNLNIALKKLESVKSPDNNRIFKVKGDRRFSVNGISFTMKAVKGGSFKMGGQWTNMQFVTLSDYMIGETEVTQDLWQAVMGDNPSCFSGANRPVETVTWDKCQTFISKLNELTGQSFRLPTEAEWEYAARGGKRSRDYRYAGSNNVDDVAWYEKNSSKTTHNVKTKTPNELGIYDMSGNVREWCQNFFSDSFRAIRGGSYCDEPTNNLVSYPTGVRQSNCASFLGLRLAL